MKLRLLIDNADKCSSGNHVVRMDARVAAAVAETFRTSRSFRDVIQYNNSLNFTSIN